jgi:hypothetical protein
MADSTLAAAFREQYRKTFVGMQIMIACVALAVLIQSHRLVAALVFFVVMQIGALLGTLWALSLKNRIEHARPRS